ncbi:RHS repeat-associated core domain-containing protein [Chitinophaga sp. LS1]|uniref:HNH endonuclease n=1 Tax=Chitinophaga sp. LS1 TaxID=3051176 RepID=UPI002AABBD3E|nr:RHS repeat-associated core domain-containing protein [Chitinophaga sp. LS1]WPV69676.1 RHS repeat-associated core domain-containing protein [Chitinophaga sp. LS1]
MDNLTYTYQANSNKLLTVTDASNTSTAKLGDFNDGTNTGDDYTYNGNGNLISDQNKQITSISYNLLNLPEKILVSGKGTINYLYTADGRKLKKTVVDSTSSPVKTTVTDYIEGLVYERDTLRYIIHEEGRIRPEYDSGKALVYHWDYFEKDHLGNVRVVLGDNADTSVYAATMETASSVTENALFSNIDNTRTALPAGYPTDETTNPNAYVARLNAESGEKIGPSIVLRVMAGDTLQLGVKAFYKSTAASTSSTTTSSMLAALIQAFSSSTISDGTHAAAGTNSVISSAYTSSEYEELISKDADENLATKPKAYLTYVLFDDLFNMVDDNSGVKQVQGNPDELQTLTVEKFLIKKTGFVYIYTSNESGENVYFDNLVVVHNRGPLLEETHYYPFGLTMAGISSNALKGANYPENRKKYSGIEYTSELDLDIYDAQFRNLDPQIGRWSQIDPKIENMEAWSPYASNYDNPIRYNDFLGDEPAEGGPGLWERLGNAVVQTGQQIVSAAAGATNAYVSNNLLGGGRIDVDNTGLIGGNAIAYQVGQKLGDAAAVYTGVVEYLAAGAGEFFSAGAGTALAVPVAIHGTTTAGLGLKNLLTNPIRNITLEERAAKLNEKDRSGKDFTPARREVVKEQNKVKNGGTMKCENCGVETPNAQKSKKGVTPPKNEAHVDHVKRKREGGRGNPDNGQVLCGGCNVEKH